MSYALISFVLIFYYGSWVFHDNPDPDKYTIGNSYTRYWLPVYMGLMPFVSIFIMRLTRVISSMVAGAKSKLIEKANKKFYRTGLRVLIIFIISFVSIRFVLWNSEESLFYLTQRQKASRAEYGKILELTEDNSVIITFYHDKLLFPERKVIVGLFNDTVAVARYARLVEFIPVYYYNFTLPEKDIDYLNSRRLGEAGLEINKIEQITKDLSLYRLDLSSKTDESAPGSSQN